MQTAPKKTLRKKGSIKIKIWSTSRLPSKPAFFFVQLLPFVYLFISEMKSFFHCLTVYLLLCLSLFKLFTPFHHVYFWGHLGAQFFQSKSNLNLRVLIMLTFEFCIEFWKFATLWIFYYKILNLSHFFICKCHKSGVKFLNSIKTRNKWHAMMADT